MQTVDCGMFIMVSGQLTHIFLSFSALDAAFHTDIVDRISFPGVC